MQWKKPLKNTSATLFFFQLVPFLTNAITDSLLQEFFFWKFENRGKIYAKKK